MSKSFVYLLKNRTDGTWYLGWTTHILRRLVEHNEGQTFSTKRNAPWQLMGFDIYPTSEQAKIRERALKHHPRMLHNPRILQLFKKRVLNRVATGHLRQVVG